MKDRGTLAQAERFASDVLLRLRRVAASMRVSLRHQWLRVLQGRLEATKSTSVIAINMRGLSSPVHGDAPAFSQSRRSASFRQPWDKVNQLDVDCMRPGIRVLPVLGLRTDPTWILNLA